MPVRKLPFVAGGTLASTLSSWRNVANGISMKNYLFLAIASGLLISAMTFNVNAQDVAPPALRASACVHEPPISIPENKLLHFDSPIRIPNSYLVQFKCEKALAVYKANAASHRSQVLAGTLPTSQANCVALASAYAARFGGSVGSVWCSVGVLRGFSIFGISEAGIVDLAMDDRVEFVEPDMVATT